MADTITLEQVHEEMLPHVDGTDTHTKVPVVKMQGWADAIDAAIKQREQDKEDAVHSGIAMALGWMYQEACRTADAGLDIRTARLTDLLERALRDLAPKESGNG